MRRTGVVIVLVSLAAGVVGCQWVQGVLMGRSGDGMPTGVPVQDKAAVNGLPAADTPVKVDGVLDDDAWEKAIAMSGFVLGDGGAPTVQSRVLITCDAANLYVAVINDEPNTDKLVTKATERDGNVWSDDSVEIYVDPANEKGSDYRGFFVSAANVVYDRRRVEAWDAEWTSATKVLPGTAWIVEIAIPFKALGVTPKVGHQLGLMVARNRLAAGGTDRSMYLVPCNNEAKDTSVYPVLELK